MKIKKRNGYEFANLLLLSLSLFLATRDSLFFENLTHVGNQKEWRFLFLFWGILQSFYFFYLYLMSLKIESQHTLGKTILATIALCLNLAGLLLPYQNGSSDLFSQLHVYGCIIATILSWLLYLHLLYDLSKKNILAFHHCLQPTLWIVCLFTFVILLFGDISSLAELILLNGLNYLFLSLQKQAP